MKKQRYLLVLLPDGDIEIRIAYQCVPGKWISGQCVRHRSYNPGDHLENNLIEEFAAMERMDGSK